MRLRREYLSQTCLGISGILLVSGCFLLPQGDTPSGALPQDTGTSLARIRALQADKGEADAFVVYTRVWIGDTSVMGPAGREQIEEITRNLLSKSHTVVVEEEYDKPELNQERVRTVVTALESRGLDPGQVVVVLGQPRSLGLLGSDAFIKDFQGSEGGR